MTWPATGVDASFRDADQRRRAATHGCARRNLMVVLAYDVIGAQATW